METSQERAVVLGPDRHHGGQPDGGGHRIPTTDPIPEAEHVVGVDSKCSNPFLCRTHRNEVPGNGLLSEGTRNPGAGAGSVRHGFLGREGFRRDDEQRALRIDTAKDIGEIGRIDIRYEMTSDLRIPESPQSLVRHNRPQIRSADTDVYDVGDHFTRAATPTT